MRYLQDATYWGPVTVDEYNEKTFGLPVAMKVRWEDRVSKTNTSDGESIVSKAVVYSKVDLEIGGHLFLGVSVAPDPKVLEDAHLILFFDKVPNLRNTKYVRKSIL